MQSVSRTNAGDVQVFLFRGKGVFATRVMKSAFNCGPLPLLDYVIFLVVFLVRHCELIPLELKKLRVTGQVKRGPDRITKKPKNCQSHIGIAKRVISFLYCL